MNKVGGITAGLGDGIGTPTVQEGCGPSWLLIQKNNIITEMKRHS